MKKMQRESQLYDVEYGRLDSSWCKEYVRSRNNAGLYRHTLEALYKETVLLWLMNNVEGVSSDTLFDEDLAIRYAGDGMLDSTMLYNKIGEGEWQSGKKKIQKI